MTLSINLHPDMMLYLALSLLLLLFCGIDCYWQLWEDKALGWLVEEEEDDEAGFDDEEALGLAPSQFLRY